MLKLGPIFLYDSTFISQWLLHARRDIRNSFIFSLQIDPTIVSFNLYAQLINYMHILLLSPEILFLWCISQNKWTLLEVVKRVCNTSWQNYFHINKGGSSNILPFTFWLVQLIWFCVIFSRSFNFLHTTLK